MNTDLNAFCQAVTRLIDDGLAERAIQALRSLVESLAADPAATGTVLRSPMLDRTCQSLGRQSLDYLRSENLLPPVAAVQAEVIIVATEVHGVGGHTRVIEDLVRARPERQHLLLLTDFFAADYPLDTERFEALGVEVRRPQSGCNGLDRLTWTQMQLACHPDAQVLLFNHHADLGAIAAVQPGLNREVVFCHHGDHHLCLGAALGWTRHVDFFAANCTACRTAGVPAEFWPLSVRDITPRTHTPESFRRSGPLRTATSGHSGKFIAPYPLRYAEVIAAMLSATSNSHLHIGPLPDELRDDIVANLNALNVDPARFQHLPQVESLAETLRDESVDLYIGSFPLGGGRALIEAMAAGIPIVTHAHLLHPALGSAGQGPAGTWCWSRPEELKAILSAATPVALADSSRAVRAHFEAWHHIARLTEAVRSPAPALQATSIEPRNDELANYLLRSSLRNELFAPVFQLVEQALNQGTVSATPQATEHTAQLLAQAHALSDRGAYVEANDLLMKALDLAPDEPTILVELGRLAILGGMPQEGYDILQQAAALSPSVLPAIEKLGEECAATGKSSSARQIPQLLRQITREHCPAGAPEAGLSRIRALSDMEWQDVLCASHLHSDYHGFSMPGFPSKQFQTATMGCSNEMAMREAFRFYQSTLPFLARMRPLSDRKYLDFGTGWGRFPRTFLKAFEPWNIHAIDVDPEMIDICQNTFSFGRFELCQPLPPSHFPDSTFDLITAYSVFSHLSEDAANRWMHEFARILRPGGIVAFTTQGSNFISLCAYFRMQQHLANPWHAQLAGCFTDQEACYADYDAGKFLYAATGAGTSEVRNASFYGEALIPVGYMIEKWGHIFDLLTFFHDQSILPQAFAVLRKK